MAPAQYQVDASVTGFAMAQDGLYYRERDGVVSKLMRVGFDGKSPRAVPLPYEGNLFGPTTDPDQPLGAERDLVEAEQP